VPEARSELLHAIYERIVVAGREFVSARLTTAAYAHGLALALPEQVARARPTERARQDSNLRPSAPEADALSAELQARDRAPVRRREGGLYSLRSPEDPETSKRLPKEPLRMLSR
jgi:hypothetical protein